MAQRECDREIERKGQEQLEGDIEDGLDRERGEKDSVGEAAVWWFLNVFK